jgi:hypothetical protein
MSPTYATLPVHLIIPDLVSVIFGGLLMLMMYAAAGVKMWKMLNHVVLGCSEKADWMKVMCKNIVKFV